MSYSLEIRPDALADIEEAAEWYEKRRLGLGIDFTRSILAAIKSLQANPLIHPLRHSLRNVRWFTSHRFPYRVVYQTQDERITVLAVLHSARADGHWKRRT
jgi:toxin ParE1/3/4